jgi:hypothetical protein
MRPGLNKRHTSASNRGGTDPDAGRHGTGACGSFQRGFARGDRHSEATVAPTLRLAEKPHLAFGLRQRLSDSFNHRHPV